MSVDDSPDTDRPARIVLVDDDTILLDALSAWLAGQGYEVVACESPSAALQALEAGPASLVLYEPGCDGPDGLGLLRAIRRHHPEVLTILLAGHGSIAQAVRAGREGALDYLTKPLADPVLRAAIERALSRHRLRCQGDRLQRHLAGRAGFENIIGTDERMLRIYELIEAVAASRATVLMTGESGTGKSLIARALHAHGDRRDGPFVEVACGALPETLLESELFGHVRGAFTGAAGEKVGKFLAAHGGTIFLDEIATASPALQVKLLRVLQERQFEPVGSNQTQTVDVRVILATNCDLAGEVQAGRFRQDLYYRVNVVNIELPALRDRPADIGLLAEHFLHRYVTQTGRAVAGFDPAALRLMQSYPWPGNIRELENCIERAVLLARGGLIGPDDLPPALRRPPAPSASPSGVNPRTLADALVEPERRILQATLARHEGNRQATAAELGINRTTLYKKMKKYGLMV